jgi:hypothetical protein
LGLAWFEVSNRRINGTEEAREVAAKLWQEHKGEILCGKWQNYSFPKQVESGE